MSKLFIISGPTCSGKDYIRRKLLKKHPNWNEITTCTSRGKMKKEKGDEYIFLDESQFEKLIEKEEMFEYAQVDGNYYGTKQADVDKALKAAMPTVFDVDVQGGKVFKEKLGNRAVLIFLKADSLQAIKKRIKSRGRGEDKKTIEKRLKRAKKELKQQKHYDYVVVNPQGRPQEAVKRIEKIIDRETN